MKTAFVFPGQGSQAVGMGREFLEKFNLFDRANVVLGFDLKKICLEGPEEELRRTAVTQPAIFTVSAMALEALRAAGIRPQIVAGHSLGEYSALYAAGAISFEDGVKILHLRGKFMQEAVPEGKGAMVAVLGLAREKIIEACAKAGGVVEAANFNSPRQVVISGEKAAVGRAAELCREAGAKRTIPLEVSAPFHCSLMKPAMLKLAAELHNIEINDAKIPVVVNVTAEPITASIKIRELLIKQVVSPVKWEDSVIKMVKDGVDTFVEVGPGKVLTGLIKKIDPRVKTLSVQEALTGGLS